MNIARIWNKHKQANSPLKRKVFVAMSGGVDSSVAALLLKEQGYDVVGVFMRCFNLDGCQERDAEDARRVAGHLGIPFYVWDFEREYKKRVVEYMVDGYRKGITPNPDVMCNKEIKFGLFLARALEAGADYIATGHYVQVAKSREQRAESKEHIANSQKNAPSAISYKLYAARDAQKDQSYFLWTLTQDELAHCLFPIGEYTKPEVREMARKAGLPTAEKKDSQGICFLGKVTLGDFLREYIPEKRGEVLLALSDVEGSMKYKKIGEHSGAEFYTIGQRHIGVANSKWQPRRKVGAPTEASGMAYSKEQRTKGKDPKPLYVASKDVRSNTVTVAEGSENPALYRKEISLTSVSFINLKHTNILEYVGMSRTQVFARVRYRQPLAKATLLLSNSRELESSEGNAKLIFDEPQKFIAPGQSAVFYLPSVALAKEGIGMEMLGGGVIV
ncbi:MAG: tRNA 2-thiouridine(34) synthase MnmA [Candidatus Liptonbacteria bacterium]|nr:tRNA 2-thiouridine(34) synthase MnmA [Candidatus Liptonbacteria bacterium]